MLGCMTEKTRAPPHLLCSLREKEERFDESPPCVCVTEPCVLRRTVRKYQSAAMQRKRMSETSMSVQADAARFAEADADGDLQLDFSEFVRMQPSKVRAKHGEAEMRTWFEAADKDGDGTVSLNEFFAWTLAKNLEIDGPGSLQALFAQYDRDSSGVLDLHEFQRVADDLGFGVAGAEIFEDLDEDGSGFLNYHEVLGRLHDDFHGNPSQQGGNKPGKKLQTKQMVMAAAWSDHDDSSRHQNARDARGAVLGGGDDETSSAAMDTSGFVLDATDASGLAAQLRAQLVQCGASIADLIQSTFMNRAGATRKRGDSALAITREEFDFTMVNRLGYTGSADLLASVFISLDRDSSGAISTDELFLFVAGRENQLTRKEIEASVLQKLSLRWHMPARFAKGLDTGAEAPAPADLCKSAPIHHLMRTATTSNLVSDVGISVDGDSVARTAGILRDAAEIAELEPWSDAELRTAMREMLTANRMSPDQLFRFFDKDSSGVLSRREFRRCMKRLFVSDGDDNDDNDGEGLEQRLALWDASRKSVLDVFDLISTEFSKARKQEETLDAVEFHRWLHETAPRKPKPPKKKLPPADRGQSAGGAPPAGGDGGNRTDGAAVTPAGHDAGGKRGVVGRKAKGVTSAKVTPTSSPKQGGEAKARRPIWLRRPSVPLCAKGTQLSSSMRRPPARILEEQIVQYRGVMWEPQYSWTGRGVPVPPPPPPPPRMANKPPDGKFASSGNGTSLLGTDSRGLVTVCPGEHAFRSSSAASSSALHLLPLAPSYHQTDVDRGAKQAAAAPELIVRVDPHAGGIRGFAAPAVRPGRYGGGASVRRATSPAGRPSSAPSFGYTAEGMLPPAITATKAEHQKARLDIRASVATLDSSLENSLAVIRSEVARLSAAGLSLFEQEPRMEPQEQQLPSTHEAGGRSHRQQQDPETEAAAASNSETQEWQRWLSETFPMAMLKKA